MHKKFLLFLSLLGIIATTGAGYAEDRFVSNLTGLNEALADSGVENIIISSDLNVGAETVTVTECCRKAPFFRCGDIRQR